MKKNNNFDDIDEMEMELEKTTGKRKIERKPINWKGIFQTIKRVIMGICKLLAVASIVCSTYIILNSDCQVILKWTLVPQIGLAAYISIKAFTLNGDK